MNLEEKLRGALDVSAPPPTTTLDHVLKRGRRRVFAQRAGAVLGVFAVVAGIGIGAATLNHAAPDPTPADQPNYGPATVEHATGWPRVNTPPQIPYGTWTPATSAPPPAGRAVVQIPLCNSKEPLEVWGLGTDVLSAKTVDALIDLVRRELPEVTVSNAPGSSIKDAIEFDLTDSGGTGSLSISAGRFPGTPQWHADDGLWATGDCEPARRLTLANGTVMQLHNIRPYEPFQSLKQVLEIYRKDGLFVRLELRNYGSPDVRPDPNQPGVLQRTGAGRATLPLSEEQFTRLGPAIAGVA
ncbi:hypothetical protein [Lentzea terrae]|uniref:hypothetical protein n=1 Tax=Lentzea terrae TaxID=2200761 RepID=UPI000DD4E4E4|nr:hypothetical protein [Lentzea terrae]